MVVAHFRLPPEPGAQGQGVGPSACLCLGPAVLWHSVRMLCGGAAGRSGTETWQEMESGDCRRRHDLGSAGLQSCVSRESNETVKSELSLLPGPYSYPQVEEGFIVVLTGCHGLQTDFTLRCMNLFKVAAGLGHRHGKHSSANLRRPSGNPD